MAKRVVVPENWQQSGKDYLTEHGMTLIEVPNEHADTLRQLGDQVDGIVYMLDPFTEDLYQALPNLKVIARHGVGYDNIDPQVAAKQGVYVTITPQANASTVAETTLADILALSKNLFQDSQHMRQGDSNYPQTHRGFDMEGKTLGIFGFGRIGQLVAQKASALGMTILYTNPHPRETTFAKQVTFDELLQQSDIVTLHAAVTPDTRKIMNQQAFAKMKPGASLINLGRGALVDESALIDALNSKRLRAAALDVFDEEPLPLDSPLYQFDNILLTPHIASNTTESMNRMAIGAASEVVRVLSGEQPQWAVNKVQ